MAKGLLFDAKIRAAKVPDGQKMLKMGDGGGLFPVVSSDSPRFAAPNPRVTKSSAYDFVTQEEGMQAVALGICPEWQT